MSGVHEERAAYRRELREPPLDRAIAELAERQYGVVSLRQLDEIGLRPRTVQWRAQAGKLHRLHRGVYAVGHTVLKREGRWMAAVLAYGPAAVLSHHSAAALWGIRQTARAAIDISLPSPNPRSRPGIDAHGTATLEPVDVTTHSGIPVTTVPRTLLDLAEVLDARGLQRAYEEAERLELLDLGAIQLLLARSNGRRGMGALRRLLAYDPSAAARTRSELERIFLDLVRDAGLPPPSVNVTVAGFEVDAYWPRARLVVELDGYATHRGRRAFERDRAKLATLKLGGYEVLALTYRQVSREPGWVVAAVRSLLARAASGVNL